MGIYSNAMMQANRIGLPREFVQQLSKDLGACSTEAHVATDEMPRTRKCSHGPTAEGCRKFCFTALHKAPKQTDLTLPSAALAEWELALWEDNMLMVSYSNFFSSTRCGVLSRGAHKARNSYSVWAPESVWHYNVQGRSATDGADQLRKKLCIAERSIQRIGNKGMSFVFDIAFTNASIMWAFVQPADTPRWKKETHFTKVPAALL